MSTYVAILVLPLTVSFAVENFLFDVVPFVYFFLGFP